MSIITLESQPGFPLEDLSDGNADKLELLMLNKEIVEQSQRFARMNSYLYKVGNFAIEMAFRDILSQTGSVAINHGIRAYEAMSALVNPVIDNRIHNDISVSKNIIELHAELREYPLVAVEDAKENLHHYPNLEGVVLENARRFCPEHLDYVQTGAGLALLLEQGALGDTHTI